jgi:hypothetical protein
MNGLKSFYAYRADDVVGSAEEGQHKKFNARKKKSLAPRSAPELHPTRRCSVLQSRALFLLLVAYAET